jgi:hypothetical protein
MDDSTLSDRAKFIRQAAMAYATAVDQSASARHGFAVFMCQPEEAAVAAKKLWDAIKDID